MLKIKNLVEHNYLTESVPNPPIKLPNKFLEANGGAALTELIQNSTQVSNTGDLQRNGSLISKVLTTYKKALEKLCGCKLYKGYVSKVSRHPDSRQFYLSPNPDKKTEQGRFQEENVTWKIYLYHDIDTAQASFGVSLYDENNKLLDRQHYKYRGFDNSPKAQGRLKGYKLI